jgi:ubiquinone/menaquinone biosynthesis C-methylase UbiE
MTGSKKFDPKKRKKLNNPVRLKWLPPELIWKLVSTGSGSTYVDIGAGTGYLTRAIADIAGSSVRIHALDIEPLMIQEMQETLPGKGSVTPQLMEMNQLPFDDHSVDGAWMITLYHELEPPKPLLEEIRRVLRPGGRLLIIDWEKNEEACEQGPPLEHRVATDTARQQIVETGFHNVQITPGFVFHYGVIAHTPEP